MITLSQSPTDDGFVQNPYTFYEAARADAGELFFWQDYAIPSALSYATVSAILRDRRFGREPPAGHEPEKPPHQAAFWALEDHSLLQLEPPRHTALRRLVLHGFTSRRIAGMGDEITALCHELIDALPPGGADLLPHFVNRLPVIVIARLLGVPDTHADKLLGWSHAIVGMYQAKRTYQMEVAAAAASQEFADFLSDYINFRRSRPGDDLITELIAAEEDGNKLTMQEMLTTCILLLNAGHEATVHTLGNGVAALLAGGHWGSPVTDAMIEEILRYDPPLHMFTRYAYEDVEIAGHLIPKNSEIGCLLGAANRDPNRWDEPAAFRPERPVKTNTSFGAGTHFCIGAPLARLELNCALSVLFARLPNLALAEAPRYASTYHFHGLETQPVTY